MTHAKLRIDHLMGLVLFSGLAFAALRNADAFWASLCFRLAILSIAVAAAGAWSRTGPARMPWAGFALAGGLTLVIWSWHWSSFGSNDAPPGPFLGLLKWHFNPAAGGGDPLTDFHHTAYSIEIMLTGCLGAIAAHFLAPKDVRPRA